MDSRFESHPPMMVPLSKAPGIPPWFPEGPTPSVVLVIDVLPDGLNAEN